MNPEVLQGVIRRQPFKPFDIVMVNGERFSIRDPESLAVVSTDSRGRRIFAATAMLVTSEGDQIITRLLDVPLIAQIVEAPINGAGNGH